MAYVTFCVASSNSVGVRALDDSGSITRALYEEVIPKTISAQYRHAASLNSQHGWVLPFRALSRSYLPSCARLHILLQTHFVLLVYFIDVDFRGTVVQRQQKTPCERLHERSSNAAVVCTCDSDLR